MKKLFYVLAFLIISHNLFSQDFQQSIITTDVDNFWMAFDKITTTADSATQYKYLQELYINKGTEGLKNIMQVRRYTAQEYINAINNYPKFWHSIRANTLKSKQFGQDVENGVDQLRKVYSELNPATIYFTIGIFRTGGTIFNNNVLIGSETALTGKNVDVSEFPESFNYYKTYVQEDPIQNITLLIVHEYVHTQQKPFVDNLLSYCLYEGVAEFVSTQATAKASTTPAIQFGQSNENLVKSKFEEEMFLMDKIYDWIWGNNTNELKVRDLGYYIGYEICQRYYTMAKDKNQAIKEMIELDFSNEEAIEKFVDGTDFFSAPLQVLYENFEAKRPSVTGIEQFKNGSQDIDPDLTRITLHFSAPMNKNYRGFDYGPLGESNVLRVENVIGFSEDGKSFTFEVALKPNQKYQSLITNRFRSVDGIPLKAYLIDIKTRE